MRTLTAILLAAGFLGGLASGIDSSPGADADTPPARPDFSGLGAGLWVGELEPVICEDREAVAAALADRWGEALVWRGVDRGMLVELYAATSGSWTLLRVSPRRCATIMLAGEGSELALAAPIGLRI